MPSARPPGGKAPGWRPAKTLDVGQEPIAVRVTKPAADALDVTCRLLGELRRLVLALLTQLLADRADVICGRRDAVTQVRRALVDLRPGLVARLRGGFLSLFLSLLAYFRCSLSHVDPPFSVVFGLVGGLPVDVLGQQSVQGLSRPAPSMEDRSPRFRIGQLAARTGVPPERLRKWESRYALLAPKRSSGGFRVYSPEDEQRVRLMERHLARGYAASEAAQLAKEGVVSPSPARLRSELSSRVVARSHRLLRKALADFDEGAAQRALDDLFSAFTVEAVLRDALLPFLREVGEAWARGETTPGQEHFAAS